MRRVLLVLVVLFLCSSVAFAGGWGGCGGRSGGGCGVPMGWGGGMGYGAPMAWGGCDDGCGVSYGAPVGWSYGVTVSGCDCGVTFGGTVTAPKNYCELPANYYEQPNEPQKTSQPAAPAPSVPTPAPKPTAPAGPGPFHTSSYRSYGPESVEVGDAKIVLDVPAAATVWINDKLTKSEGTHREYKSQGLIVGREYRYRVVVQLGDQVAQRDVILAAGQTKVVH
jgi:uncharacterized protein (TIGR03000 family)